MKTITSQDVAKEVAVDREDIDRLAAQNNCPQWMMPVFEAGEWISRRMMRDGATEQQTKDVSFALGQRVCMRGLAAAYEVAAECYNRWVEDHHMDKPGFELANRLIDGREKA